MKGTKGYVIVAVLAIIGLFAAYHVYSKVSTLADSNQINRLPTVKSQPNHVIPPFKLTDHLGNEVTNADYEDVIYVVNFFFTTCAGICPAMNANVAKLQEGIAENINFKILSLTVDPEHDDVITLKKYSRLFDVDPERWRMVTGDKEEIYNLAEKGFLVSAGQENEDITPEFIHTSRLVLVDHKGQIRGFYEGTEEESVKTLAKDLLLLWKHDYKGEDVFYEVKK